MNKVVLIILLLAGFSSVSFSQILDEIDVYEKDSVVKYAVTYDTKDSVKRHRIVGKYAQYPSQKALVIHYKGSLRHGREVIYYPNKKKSIVKHFHKGRRQGLWKLYNEGGKLLGKGKYRNDHRNGVWTEYINGKKVGSTTYLDGFQMRGQFLNHPIHR